MTFIIALILVSLALTGLFIIIVPIGVYVWYRIELRKRLNKGKKK